MVGYPNVGKSSTINVLLKDKKVSVSSTPGKTKHFQTLSLSPDICLCDCPGLVFPTFMSSSAALVSDTPPSSLILSMTKPAKPASLIAYYSVRFPFCV